MRKVWEKLGGATEERVYLGGFEVYRRVQAGARLERETLHVMDDKQRIALVETRTEDTAGVDHAPAELVRFQLGNHLGSSAVELDERAQLISYEEYAPYGSTTYQAVRSQTETPKRYRFTGMERDEETGLQYHHARYYVPWLGRWASADPGGLVDAPSLYVYCRGNPIALHDPSGMQGTAGDDDGPSFHYEEVPPDPSGRPTPSLRLVYDLPPVPPLDTAAGDASVPFVLPWYNSPGILGANTGVLLTQPNVSSPVGGQHGLQFPSAVPGSPATSYLTMTWPAPVGQSQFSVGPDSTGAPNTWTYQHQFGPSDPKRSGGGGIVSGSVTWSGIAGLTTDPTFSVGGMYLHEWTFGGETERPFGSFGVNVGGGLGRGLSLTTGGMGGYGDVGGSIGASLFPAGYYNDTPAANADYTGPLVEPSQVPRLTISVGAYGTGFLGGPIDSSTSGVMRAGAAGGGVGATWVTPRFGVNTRLFVSGYAGYGGWADNSGGGNAGGVFGSLGVGFLFGAAPTRPNPSFGTPAVDPSRHVPSTASDSP